MIVIRKIVVLLYFELYYDACLCFNDAWFIYFYVIMATKIYNHYLVMLSYARFITSYAY